MKPSLFTEQPFGSTLQKMESEIIAKNIMIILKRTGDVFRELTWEEYKTERLKDNDFQEGEKTFFEQVIYLAKGNKNSILNFSSTWKDSYIKELENNIKK